MNSSDPRPQASAGPPVGSGLPPGALPLTVPPADSRCPDEQSLTEYAAGPTHHPDRRRLAEHLQHCTRCALTVGGLAKLRQEARGEIGRAGALKYLRGDHPNPRRFEDHSERCRGCRAWLAALRPFFRPAFGSPKVAWATSIALCAALMVSVSTRPEPVPVAPKDVLVPVGAQVDSRAVAEYLQRFSVPRPSAADVAELRKLTNLLESRLYGDAALERDPSFLLLVGALFQRRHELTGEARASAKSTELVREAQRLLAARPSTHRPANAHKAAAGRQ